MTKDVWTKLAAKSTPCLWDTFERKISGQGAVRAGKRFTLLISDEDMNAVIKIVQSLEKSGLLINRATETMKYEIKRQAGRFLWAMMALMATKMAVSLIATVASSLIKPVTSLLLNAISGKEVMRAGKGQEGGFLPLLALPQIWKF